MLEIHSAEWDFFRSGGSKFFFVKSQLYFIFTNFDVLLQHDVVSLHKEELRDERVQQVRRGNVNLRGCQGGS